MRLRNIQKAGKFEYRVLLDDKKVSVNYIERTTGVYYGDGVDEHICLKCMEEVNWYDWPTPNRSKVTCDCGEKQTLELILFDQSAEDVG